MVKFFITSKNYHEVKEFLGVYAQSASSDTVYDPVTRSNERMPVLVVNCEKIAENVYIASFPDRKFDLFKLPDGKIFVYSKHDGTCSGPVADNWIFDPAKCVTVFFGSDVLALEYALKFVKNKKEEKSSLEYIIDSDTNEFFCARKSQKAFLDVDWRLRNIKKYPVIETVQAKIY